MLGRLLPKKTEFFDLFARQARLAVEGARLLHAMLDELPKAEEGAARVHAVEHEADSVCQAVMEQLHSSFITPIERGDVHRIASGLDDVLDHVEAAAQCIWLYGIRDAAPEIREMTAHLIAAAEALARTVESLAPRIDAARTRALCREVKHAERENDRLLRRATARLFREEQDARALVMWKEIFANVEDAVNRCEDVANVIEGVVLENA